MATSGSPIRATTLPSWTSDEGASIDVTAGTMRPNLNDLDGYDNETLTGLDYTIVALLLMISVGIGAFYAWKDRDQEEDNYMMGGRQMKVLPSAISLIATFVPSTAMIGQFAETNLLL